MFFEKEGGGEDKMKDQDKSMDQSFLRLVDYVFMCCRGSAKCRTETPVSLTQVTSDCSTSCVTYNIQELASCSLRWIPSRQLVLQLDLSETEEHFRFGPKVR